MDAWLGNLAPSISQFTHYAPVHDLLGSSTFQAASVFFPLSRSFVDGQTGHGDDSISDGGGGTCSVMLMEGDLGRLCVKTEVIG